MSDTQKEIEASIGVGHAKSRVPGWLWWVLAVAVLGGIGVWWMRDAEERKQVSYVTEAVTKGAMTVYVTATGTIEPTNLVEISSELSGTMAEVFVDYNDKVTAGQVLARLDTVQLEAQLAVQEASHAVAQAQLESARASLVEATADFEIVRRLDERGITSHANLTAAQASLARAGSAVASAEANLALAAAQLEAQRAVLSKATIVSPIDGVVLKRSVDAGQIVAASLSAPELFTIAQDLAQMELQVDVAEADIGRISLGDEASFTVDAFDDLSFPAKISMVRFASDSTDGLVTYKAILSVENDDLLLRPGMTATAEIMVARYSEVLLVPNAALRFAPPQVAEEDATEDQESGGGLLGLIMPSRNSLDRRTGSDSTVWVQRDGAAVEMQIEKGDSDGLQTIVTGGELEAGMAVITDMIEGR